jgi:hypothetical protein
MDFLNATVGEAPTQIQSTTPTGGDNDAGPMGYDKDLRGIFIIDAKDSAEAASYIKTDSAIILGRLRFEVHPWWTAKGKYEFK